MINAFKNRTPLATAAISFPLGPVIGMLYLNRGKWALFYFAITLLVIAPFLLAHFGVPYFDPREFANMWMMIVTLCGAAHCFFAAKRPLPQPRHWYSRRYYLFIIFLLAPIILALLFRTYCCEPFNASSISMEPTLHPEDYFFINKHAYTFGHLPERGDIMVFNVHVDGQTVQYIKRVIGLPGDNIKIDDEGMSINGIMTTRTPPASGEGGIGFLETLPNGKMFHVFGSGNNSTDSAFFNTYEVDAGHYFVAGDNWGHSHDSRNGLGLISAQDIIGKAVAIIWNSKTYKFSYQPIE